MQNEGYQALLEEACEQLQHGGAFLMTGKEEQNPMTIGWGQWGIIWGIPVCTVLVRHTRHSHALLERDRVFTVSAPAAGTMKKELGFCGSRSGRNVDKKQALGLTTLEPQAGGIAPLSGCAIHFECEVVYSAEMKGNMDALNEAQRAQFYNPAQQEGEDGNPHTIYYGRILAAYRTEQK